MAEHQGSTATTSAEEIAFKLLISVAAVEGKVVNTGTNTPYIREGDRKWLLDTYAECLLTVRNPDGRRSQKFTFRLD